MAQESVSKRDQALSIDSIDEEYIVGVARKTWSEYDMVREDNLQKSEAVESSWRDLRARENVSPWDWGSNFHVPLTLTYGKAVHARLWQLFSNPNGFYSVDALKEGDMEKEVPIKQFMDWVLYKYTNNKLGARREFDRWLWDLAFGGSGYLKVYWKKSQREYRDVVVTPELTETLFFDPQSATGKVRTESKLIEKEQDVVEELETPQIRRILAEDIAMPLGYHDPQDCPSVVLRCYMDTESLKEKARQKIFYSEAVEFSLDFTESRFLQNDNTSTLKTDRAEMDGYDPNDFADGQHVILEYYGPAYIQKKVNEDDLDKDITKKKREIVAWIHKASGRVLGWTYLSRISPSGLRPIFKADYVTFPERSDGVGVGEMLYDIQRNVDALHNLRMDNGTLASIPMFAYRAGSSSLKPHIMKIRPGEGIPVDDVNDVRPFNFPFLTGFGNQEQGQLTDYAERLLALSDLQLGRAPNKVGALRNATGSNLLAQESGIQLEIHFDRIAECMSKLLKCLFELCRERMPEELFFRVMGERGQPIFGQVSRKDLRGEFDFNISADILGQSQLEKQQMAMLVMQTLQQPVNTQTGIVTPENLYNMAKNFLKVHKIARVDDFITPPPDYKGPRLDTESRLARIMTGQGENIAETVRLDEDHTKALQALENFQSSDLFGVLGTQTQIAQFQELMNAHMQMQTAQAAGPTMPNQSGMQIPGEGIAPDNMGGIAPDQVGVPNGPVV
jgi:hypothetical protein